MTELGTINQKLDYLCILNIVHDTIVDGPGLRTSIYAAGCPHACKGCHNPQSWSKENGYMITVGEIMNNIVQSPVTNVTFSGGEPFLQTQGFLALAKRIKRETNKTIWCYTGFRYESLLSNSECTELLSYIDVLVDGPYLEKERDLTLRFRGSKNQRIIHIKEQLGV